MIPLGVGGVAGGLVWLTAEALSPPLFLPPSLSLSALLVGKIGQRKAKGSDSYLRDTLPVLSPVEDGPRNAAGVLALEEERLGFAVLESEDLAVATDVKFTL